MTHEDYCSFEVSKLLKEKGFDWEVRAYYQYDSESKEWDFELDDREDSPSLWGDYYVSAPTHQMARRWLRETHGIDIIIDISNPSVKNRKYYCMIWDGNNNSYILDLFNSYEEADEAALEYCLENLI